METLFVVLLVVAVIGSMLFTHHRNKKAEATREAKRSEEFNDYIRSQYAQKLAERPRLRSTPSKSRSYDSSSSVRSSSSSKVDSSDDYIPSYSSSSSHSSSYDSGSSYSSSSCGSSGGSDGGGGGGCGGGGD